MTRFTMDQLDTLRAVVDEGGFEAAARRLHMTQSAVSQRIKQLERASGQVLLRRSTPVAPTAAGDVVLRYARQVDLLAAEALSELGGAEPSASPTTLAIAVNADSSATWFLEALAGMPPQLPVVFDLRRADQQHTAALLRSGDVLAAVTSTREAVQGCSSEALGTMRYRAVASPGYRDRWLGGVADVSRLDGAPMLVFDRTDELQHDFVRSAVGYDPARRATTCPRPPTSHARPSWGWAGACCPRRRRCPRSTRADWSSSRRTARSTSPCSGSAGPSAPPRSTP
nr:hypothetical protein GCM10025699_51680 [Microbacterium flavescens]